MSFKWKERWEWIQLQLKAISIHYTIRGKIILGRTKEIDFINKMIFV